MLLREDFNGSMLDNTNWVTPQGPGTFFGRTQIRPPSERLQLTGGMLQLSLDTYNPSALVPGDSFWGSEIVSRQTFSLEAGLAFSARVALPRLPRGIVASLFSYVTDGTTRDEIDFELLSNDNQVLTNAFSREGFASPGRPQVVGTIVPSSLTDLSIEWYPDRVRWLVNGQVVRTLNGTIAQQPVNIRLNLWAPGPEFAQAFDSALVPASQPQDNATYLYEVDSVEVRRLQSIAPVSTR